MSIGSLWREIEAALAPSPAVAAALRPPISEALLQRWSSVVGPLPAPLESLYAGHEGTDQAGGGSGFCFIGNWYPLPVESAVDSYELFRPLMDAWGTRPLIPFAKDYTGCRLGMPTDGSQEVHIMFLDTPGGIYRPSLESLMSATVDGLRGDDEEYRAKYTEQYLIWVNRELEAEDLAH